MQKKLWPALIGLTLLVAYSIALCAAGIEDQKEVVAEYTKGRRLMRESDYFGASKVFQQLEGRFPDSKNLDLFVLHRSKCDFYLGEFAKAAAGFSFFLNRFAGSAETPYAHFFLANCQYRQGQGAEAVQNYLDAYRLSQDNRLDDLVRRSIEAALANASAVTLDPTFLENIPEHKRCPIVRSTAPYLAQSSNRAAAERLLTACGEQMDRYQRRVQNSSPSNETLSIPMMLPFSGELSGYGQEIYNGAVIAAERFRRESGLLIELVPHDTKGDPMEAARLAAELSQDRSIPAAIGPLTSDAAAVTSATLACRELPLVIPAATQAGLARLSKNTFQLSPNIELQGLIMAQYAVDSLKADSAVIVTSTAADHLRMSRAFARRFETLGGEVVAVEYYRSRDKDFGPYLRDVKAMLWDRHPDSIFFTNEYGDTLDPDGIPVQIDCLYLPGSPQQLRQLLPQIHFYKIEGAYLGSDGWADDAILRLGDDVTRGAVLPSPFLSAFNSEEYTQFAAAYDTRYGMQPPRLAALGYDALRLISLTIAESAGDRDKLVKRLAATRDFVGASGRITWSDQRENTNMPLYRISSGVAQPLTPPTTVADEPPIE
ncbi:MAG: penicillin-binding protein activator [candidate division Zixibacteria bacterium]|nr:penicillin-binding protein activator [candidate division Zixibacteria bacterium]MDH3936736.1 penicillin-binding protein activator [candidate division Zixibacteria bacterium]MDH4032679.1 penicillin-binding protein activator [candidate division Zixibacteria bacterium]